MCKPKRLVEKKRGFNGKPRVATDLATTRERAPRLVRGLFGQLGLELAGEFVQHIGHQGFGESKQK
ncbi:hypothetical protein HNQ59_003315 [Chitinivorax tropicus]|uniref:Uncharacterized protein n=1 Tax=Chitinivorax tropicus TaxID=714531 RepID=A0A840MS86_9PROT|nr:hypothetical protein [Chitinivorax tropicus]